MRQVGLEKYERRGQCRAEKKIHRQKVPDHVQALLFFCTGQTPFSARFTSL
jgi:hypothetical protein